LIVGIFELKLDQMKNILIPTDFSDNASDALGYALNFLGGSKANIHIVNVVPVHTVPGDVPINTSDLVTSELKEARKAMEALEEFSKVFYGNDQGAQITVSTKVAIGGVAFNIKKEAQEVNADLIIMGTQGTNHSFVEKILGSISTTTISDSPCPVVLVPIGYKFKTIDNIIFATNLNHSDPYELWRATELIKPHIGRIRCVYVTKDESSVAKDELETFAKYMVEHSPSIQTVFNVEESDNVEKTLSDYAENYDAEMVIMHRSKKSFWKDLFGARHTKKMASWLKIPLMVMQNNE
jgi:nucleotide-binding universal stress UspA family protein